MYTTGENRFMNVESIVLKDFSVRTLVISKIFAAILLNGHRNVKFVNCLIVYGNHASCDFYLSCDVKLAKFASGFRPAFV